MGNKVICTGGAGRLGQFVARRLAPKCTLTIVDLVKPQDDDLDSVPFINADIRDLDALRKAFAGHDALVHLAAIPNPRTAPADVTFATNVQGAWSVLQAAEDVGVKRVVVASSDSVFGLSYNPPDWPPQFLPVDETHPVRPTEFYSLSKHVTETIAESFAARAKLEVIVLRPVHVVFPPEYPELEERGSDPQNYHFWTFVAPEDVAQAFDLALQVEYQGYEVFTISGADGLNTQPTLEMAKQRWGTLPEVRDPALYAANPCASVMDISRARRRLGYAPQVTWRQMIGRDR
ncbi:MAG: NAD-dependent epimerase/dehydratase family protein [Hyphomicrobiaceae bacterium]